MSNATETNIFFTLGELSPQGWLNDFITPQIMKNKKDILSCEREFSEDEANINPLQNSQNRQNNMQPRKDLMKKKKKIRLALRMPHQIVLLCSWPDSCTSLTLALLNQHLKL